MKIVTVVLAVVVALSAPALAQVPGSHIRDIIQKEVENKRSKSIIVGIIDSTGTQIISAGVLSDLDQRQPDGNTIYEIGSITKMFTGLLLVNMSLKQEVRLQDLTVQWLPKTVNGPSIDGHPVTLLDLAIHRSGLPRNPYILDPVDLENPFADYSVEQLYGSIWHLEDDHNRKARFRYSNLGYNLLGHILTIAANKDFESLVKERVTVPLGMKSTAITLTPEQRKNLAAPHSAYGKPAMEWDIAFAGGGGLRSSTNDMLSFAAANLGLVETPLLPAMELSHIPQAKKEGSEGLIAMGWTVFDDGGEQMVWKDGSTGGYHTFIGLDKKHKRGVVVLSNTVNSITDIGLHLLDSTRALVPYRYPWTVHDTVYSVVQEQGVEKAIGLYKFLKDSQSGGLVFDEQQLNCVGNDLRKANRIEDAIKLYRINLEDYPNSVLTYESLAETYKRSGKKELAIEAFEQLARIDGSNPRWSWMVNRLKGR